MRSSLEQVVPGRRLRREARLLVSALPLLATLGGCKYFHSHFPDNEGPPPTPKGQRDDVVGKLKARGEIVREGGIKQALLEAVRTPSKRPSKSTIPKWKLVPRPASAGPNVNAPCCDEDVVFEDSDPAMVVPGLDRKARLPGLDVTAEEFVKDFECRTDGCFKDVVLPKDREAVVVEGLSQLIAHEGSALESWKGWRFLSSVFEEKGEKKVTVVLLAPAASAQKKGSY
jgi:hypothetical protein